MTAIGLGFAALMAGALAVTAFGWNGYLPVLLGLGVAVATAAGPLLFRVLHAVVGSKASTVASVSGDLLLASIAAATLVLGAWLAGRVEVACVRDPPGADARCTIQEYRWLGRVRAVDRTVSRVRSANVTGHMMQATKTTAFGRAVTRRTRWNWTQRRDRYS